MSQSTLPTKKSERCVSPRPRTLGLDYDEAEPRVIADDGEFLDGRDEEPSKDESKITSQKKYDCLGIVQTPIEPAVDDLLREFGILDPNYAGLEFYSSSTDPNFQKVTAYSPLAGTEAPNLIGMDGTPSPTVGIFQFKFHGLRKALACSVGAIGIDIYKDGKPSTGAAASSPCIWTLRLTGEDKKLYVFRNGRILDSPVTVTIPGVHIVPKHYFHDEYILSLETPSPVLKVVTKSDDPDYGYPKANIKETVPSTQCADGVHVIRRDAFYLTLDFQSEPKVITLSESELRRKLESIKRNKQSLEEAKFIPFINIAADSGNTDTCNLAFYFTTSTQYHFVHVDDQSKKPVIKTVPKANVKSPRVEIRKHLQFSDDYRYHGEDRGVKSDYCDVEGDEETDSKGQNGASDADALYLSSVSSKATDSLSKLSVIDSLQSVQSVDSGFGTNRQNSCTDVEKDNVSMLSSDIFPELEPMNCTVPFHPTDKSPRHLSVDVSKVKKSGVRIEHHDSGLDLISEDGNGVDLEMPVENGSSRTGIVAV